MDPIPRPDTLNPAPPRPDFTDPTYQKKVEHDVVNVAKITAELGAIARFVPNPVLKFALSAFVGLQKDPHTGKVGPGVNTLQNLGPSPLGFSDAELYGLRRNYWLPEGATNYLPAFPFDKLPGVPEQRRVDNFVNARDRALMMNAAQLKLENESEQTLNQLTQGLTEPFSRGNFIIAFSGIRADVLRDAAKAELLLRQLPERPARLVPVVLELPDGSFQPALIQPNNTLATASADAAEGIRKELVTEHADP